MGDPNHSLPTATPLPADQINDILEREPITKYSYPAVSTSDTESANETKGTYEIEKGIKQRALESAKQSLHEDMEYALESLSSLESLSGLEKELSTVCSKTTNIRLHRYLSGWTQEVKSYVEEVSNDDDFKKDAIERVYKEEIHVIFSTNQSRITASENAAKGIRVKAKGVHEKYHEFIHDFVKFMESKDLDAALLILHSRVSSQGTKASDTAAWDISEVSEVSLPRESQKTDMAGVPVVGGATQGETTEDDTTKDDTTENAHIILSGTKTQIPVRPTSKNARLLEHEARERVMAKAKTRLGVELIVSPTRDRLNEKLNLYKTEYQALNGVATELYNLLTNEENIAARQFINKDKNELFSRLLAWTSKVQQLGRNNTIEQAVKDGIEEYKNIISFGHSEERKNAESVIVALKRSIQSARNKVNSFKSELLEILEITASREAYERVNSMILEAQQSIAEAEEAARKKEEAEKQAREEDLSFRKVVNAYNESQANTSQEVARAPDESKPIKIPAPAATTQALSSTLSTPPTAKTTQVVTATVTQAARPVPETDSTDFPKKTVEFYTTGTQLASELAANSDRVDAFTKTAALPPTPVPAGEHPAVDPDVLAIEATNLDRNTTVKVLESPETSPNVTQNKGQNTTLSILKTPDKVATKYFNNSQRQKWLDSKSTLPKANHNQFEGEIQFETEIDYPESEPDFKIPWYQNNVIRIPVGIAAFAVALLAASQLKDCDTQESESQMEAFTDNNLANFPDSSDLAESVLETAQVLASSFTEDLTSTNQEVDTATETEENLELENPIVTTPETGETPQSFDVTQGLMNFSTANQVQEMLNDNQRVLVNTGTADVLPNTLHSGNRGRLYMTRVVNGVVSHAGYFTGSQRVDTNDSILLDGWLHFRVLTDNPDDTIYVSQAYIQLKSEYAYFIPELVTPDTGFEGSMDLDTHTSPQTEEFASTENLVGGDELSSWMASEFKDEIAQSNSSVDHISDLTPQRSFDLASLTANVILPEEEDEVLDIPMERIIDDDLVDVPVDLPSGEVVWTGTGKAEVHSPVKNQRKFKEESLFSRAKKSVKRGFGRLFGRRK